MVRMSDLVRGPAALPPAPAPDEEERKETPAPAPAASPRAERQAPARLALRTIDVAVPAPAAAAAPRAPRAVPQASAASLAAPAPAPPAAPAPSVGETPRRIFEDLQALLAAVREHVRGGSAPAWPELERILQRVVAALEESAELFWLANAPAVPAGVEYLVAHQSRVAILAARIGLNVGYDRARATALGMAGALIDVGLWQSPDSLLRRLDNLGADEQAAYRAHPERSAALLTQWGAPAPLVEAVLQHHEREQGQGFPQHLTGAAIGQDAKILGLVDAYTGLTLPASRRPGLRPHEAIREIVRSKHESFSPALIKALLSEISVFPPGTLVRLNTGEVGQVTAVNRNHPLRPRVEVVADSKGNRPVTPKTIDLSETPFLYITGPVSESTK
jgi:HD-GYP domain-containing protein (c-di-GMP phosphodiesterase class II)